MFIFNILNELSGQLRVPSALHTAIYHSVGLPVDLWLHGYKQAVWMCSRRDKYLAPARNRKTIPQTSSRVLITILGVTK